MALLFWLAPFLQGEKTIFDMLHTARGGPRMHCFIQLDPPISQDPSSWVRGDGRISPVEGRVSLGLGSPHRPSMALSILIISSILLICKFRNEGLSIGWELLLKLDASLTFGGIGV